MRLSDLDAMKLAMEQARAGIGFVSPNPVVGCVILDANGELLSHGYHAKAGQDHAEICALRKISNPKLLIGASVYVTLEPCSHVGRTPACAKTLADFPIREVIYGVKDPNPVVSGRGLEMLAAAGKSVRTLPELHSELEELAEIFLFNMRSAQTFVALKVATSLDGKLAFHSGESQWITHELARAKANELRGAYDAIAVGASTVLQDHPRLTLRHPRYVGKKQGAVVVLDPEGVTLKSLRDMPFVTERGGLDQVFVVVSNKRSFPDAIPASQMISCPMLDDSALDLRFLTQDLLKRGICSLFVEGGAKTHSEFIRQGVAQRLYQFVSPILMGDPGATTWTKFLNISKMSDRLELANVRWEPMGPDSFVTGLLPRISTQ